LYVDHTQKALISSLELALIEDLYCDNGRILDHDIKVLIPIRIKGLFDHTRRVCLLRIDGDDSEWAGKSEDIALGQTISSNDCDPD
jgi:hypothetical protein